MFSGSSGSTPTMTSKSCLFSSPLSITSSRVTGCKTKRDGERGRQHHKAADAFDNGLDLPFARAAHEQADSRFKFGIDRARHHGVFRSGAACSGAHHTRHAQAEICLRSIRPSNRHATAAAFRQVVRHNARFHRPRRAGARGGRVLRRVEPHTWGLFSHDVTRPATAHARAVNSMDSSFETGSRPCIRSRSTLRRSSASDMA
jgi:hypothetical protein